MKRTIYTSMLLVLASGLPAAVSQNTGPTQDPLTETGQLSLNGHTAHYVIHHLPPSSFPDLPASIADQLNRRACLVPQTYEAHEPENVVHASLEQRGSNDWALLCSVKGTVSLLVFFASAPQRPITLASAPESERLQEHNGGHTLGFNWGIDPASPKQVHTSQLGMPHPPPALDHDAVADSVIDHHTVYHFFSNDKWTLLDVPY